MLLTNILIIPIRIWPWVTCSVLGLTKRGESTTLFSQGTLGPVCTGEKHLPSPTIPRTSNLFITSPMSGFFMKSKGLSNEVAQARGSGYRMAWGGHELLAPEGLAPDVSHNVQYILSSLARSYLHKGTRGAKILFSWWYNVKSAAGVSLCLRRPADANLLQLHLLRFKDLNRNSVIVKHQTAWCHPCILLFTGSLNVNTCKRLCDKSRS